MDQVAKKERKAAYAKAWRAANRERKAAQNRAWNGANKERRAALMRAWLYNLTPEQHAAMIVAQSGACLLCSQVVKLCVDHDHDSGKVRGLLCQQCNQQLGVIEKLLDRRLLGRFLAYIEAHRG